MKKFFALLLALAMIFALAACGDTKEADVVAEGDVKDTTIETPPPAAIISGPDTPQEQYPSVNVLPATDPTPNANPGAVIAPATGTTPSAGNVTGTTGNTGAAPSAGGGTATGVPIENYSPNSGTGTTGTTGTGEPVYDNILDPRGPRPAVQDL